MLTIHTTPIPCTPEHLPTTSQPSPRRLQDDGQRFETRRCTWHKNLHGEVSTIQPAPQEFTQTLGNSCVKTHASPPAMWELGSAGPKTLDALLTDTQNPALTQTAKTCARCMQPPADAIRGQGKPIASCQQQTHWTGPQSWLIALIRHTSQQQSQHRQAMPTPPKTSCSRARLLDDALSAGPGYSSTTCMQHHACSHPHHMPLRLRVWLPSTLLHQLISQQRKARHKQPRAQQHTTSWRKQSWPAAARTTLCEHAHSPSAD